MEAALQKEKELSQLKSHFVSLVSHEFRTPLSTIFSSSQLIEKYIDEASHSKRIRHTNKIQTSVSVLNNMIEDILSLSKLDEGKVNLKIERFDLYRLCQNIIGDLKSIYADLSVNLIGEDAMIKSDPKLVKHILSNIIENACKYGKKGGEVKVELSKVNSHVEVTVADNGIGIPDEEQKNLFDRFYRASNAENIKGTGLGLNIVMKYLDILGGAINFESEQNVGTSFHITIPKK
jgi:signal transduction histidine kinase